MGTAPLGISLSSSKYHRDQAQLLAGLALSTKDATKADRFKLAAMEHLQRAQALEGDTGQTHTPDLAPTMWIVPSTTVAFSADF